MNRHDQRAPDELRPVKITRFFTGAAPGSVLIEAGRTTVLCTASVQGELPKWMAGQTSGWVTAEYSMLPGSTNPRKSRDRGAQIDGRTSEIQRLVGRSLRSIVDLAALGPRTVTIDCDVLEADGGTRTASITGAFVALVDALRSIAGQLPNPGKLPLLDNVAAVSVGLIDDGPLLDLDYSEDVVAAVDMNVVMTGGGRFVEVQGTGEEATFSEADLTAMLGLARGGIRQLTQIQRAALGPDWPLPS